MKEYREDITKYDKLNTVSISYLAFVSTRMGHFMYFIALWRILTCVAEHCNGSPMVSWLCSRSSPIIICPYNISNEYFVRIMSSYLIYNVLLKAWSRLSRPVAGGMCDASVSHCICSLSSSCHTDVIHLWTTTPTKLFFLHRTERVLDPGTHLMVLLIVSIFESFPALAHSTVNFLEQPSGKGQGFHCTFIETVSTQRFFLLYHWQLFTCGYVTNDVLVDRH